MNGKCLLCGLLISTAPLILPQGGLYADGAFEHASHEEENSVDESIALSFRLYRLVHPLGIATYVSLWITFLFGLLKCKFHVRRISMKWHYGFAILTLVLATLHASIVLFIH